MDEQNQNNRPMFTGDWPCSKCGNSITELPFQPDPERMDRLTCKDCFQKGKDERQANRPMFQGAWNCAGCNADITELPFEPRDTSNLKCRDCFKSGK